MHVIDFDKAWRLMGGDPGLYRDLFAIIERTLPEKYGNIRRALASNSAVDLELYAHQLKGALRNVAADKACDVLWQLEVAGTLGELERGRELFAQVPPLVDELLAVYRAGGWEAEFRQRSQGR